MSRGKSTYNQPLDDNLKLNRKLRDKESVLNDFLSSIPDTIYNIDIHGNIESTNRSFNGIPENSITGKNFLELIPPEEHDRIKRIHEKVFKNGKPWVYEYKGFNDGQYFSASIGAIKKGQKITGAVILTRDITKCKQAQETMLIEEDFTAKLFETAQVIVLVLDTNGKIVRFNPYMEELSGYTLEEAKGLDWFDTFIPEEDRSRIRKVFSKAVKGIQIEGNINPILTKKGQKRQIEWFSEILKGAGGTNVGLLALGQDITERMKAEETLRNKELQLSDAMKIAKIGYWEYDALSKVFLFNDQFYSLFRTTAEETGGYSLSIDDYAGLFVHPDDREIFVQKISQCVEANDSSPMTELGHKILYAGGGEGFMSVRVFVTKDEKGTVKKIFGANQDITEWVKAELALRTSEAHLSNALKIAGLGYWEFDVGGNLFKFNDEFYAIFRTTAEQAGGYTMTSEQYAEKFVYEEDRVVVAEEVRKALETNDPNYSRQLEHRIKYADGETGYISVRFIIIKDRYGRTIKTYGANQDITERKRAEKKLEEQNEKYIALNEKLSESLDTLQKINSELGHAKQKAEESDKLKSAFLANMSHEIRTPMNGIIGFSNMLNKPSLSEEKKQQYTQIINDMCRQLLHLIDDILDISKIETGQLKIFNTAASVNDILIRLFTFYKPVTSKNNINLFVYKTLSDEKAKILTDHLKLRQVMDNLISNAIKFTHQGYIKFGYCLKNGWLEFYVEDTGIGIAPEIQKTIFERFRQADIGTSKLYGGAGLGLSISKAYVENMGGKIWVNSMPGAGASFRFTIPYEPVNEKREDGILLEEDSKLLPLLLVVEDEEVNYLFFEEVLMELSIEILHARNGAEAIDICKKNPDIRLVLMDIKLPDLDGYEVIKQIKTHNPDIPIIAQTAYALRGDREKALEAGCVDYMAKPINDRELIEKVKGYIGF